jgi:hypothetical protein
MMKRYLPLAIVTVVFFIAAGAGTSLFFWKERAQPSKSASIKNEKPGARPAPHRRLIQRASVGRHLIGVSIASSTGSCSFVLERG